MCDEVLDSAAGLVNIIEASSSTVEIFCPPSAVVCAEEDRLRKLNTLLLSWAVSPENMKIINQKRIKSRL